MRHLAFIAYGSNMGNKQAFISQALAELEGLSSVELTLNSSIYKSKSWGYESAHEFYNGVCAIRTSLSAVGLLSALQRIEKNLGRASKTTSGYADRVIDLDIISYDLMVLDTEHLTVPHGLAHVRNFVLEPLAEISSEWFHPLYLESAEALLNRLNSNEPLTKIDAL